MSTNINHNILEKIANKTQELVQKDIHNSIFHYIKLYGTLKYIADSKTSKMVIERIQNLSDKLDEPIFVIFEKSCEILSIKNDIEFRYNISHGITHICQPLYILQKSIFESKMNFSDKDWFEKYKNEYYHQESSIFYIYGPNIFIVPCVVKDDKSIDFIFPQY